MSDDALVSHGPLRVRLLGRVRLWRGDREIPVRPGQQRAIVALLALAGGQPVRRTEIIDALWGHGPPAGAWNVVQTHVKRLRAMLEPERAARAGSVALPRAGDGYRLPVRPDDVDLLRFAALAQQARDAQREGRQSLAYTLLADAFGQWRAAPLADVPLLAEHPAIVAADRRRWIAAGWYADAALALGRAGEVLALAEQAAAANPLDEPAAARLVRLYLALGRREDAFTAYRDARRRLVDGLGVEPGPDLQAAYRGGLRAVPAEPPPTARPAQLPGDIADFTGRRSAVERIVRLLGAPGPAGGAVVALVGMGGIGKSAFAVHVGRRIADRFPDGQLYAELRGATAGEVLGGLLRGLGVPSVPDGADERAALYRSRLAGRRVLIVLDDAADETQVRPLLPGHPACAVIVTSRNRLGALTGAHPVAVGELDPDDAWALLRRLVGADRVHRHPAAAAEIVDICAGVPLALRVTGARLATHPHRTLPWLAERLRDQRRRLDELATGDLAVRSSLALSYAGIPAPARRALRRLSLLDTPDAADWTLAALLDVPQREAEALTDVLVGAHLLAVNGTDATGSPRYRLHDLVRLYARERATVLDPPAVRRAALGRAFGAFLHLAETGDERLACRYLGRRIGPAERRSPAAGVVERLLAAPTAWFDAERANLLAVTGQAAASGHADQAWNLADAAVGFYEMRDLRDDWAVGHVAALDAARAYGDPLGHAVMARNLAYRASAAIVGDVAAMRAHAGTAYERFTAAGDACGRAESLVLLGEVERTAGAGGPAAALFTEALTLARRGRHTLVQSVAHNEIAWLCHERGDDREAARHCRHSLRLSAGRGGDRARYSALRLLGLIDVRHGRLVRGEATLRQALDLARAMASPVKQARVLRELGGLRLAAGRTVEAAATLAEARELSLAAGDRLEQAFTDRWLGRLALAEGRPRQATAALTDALDTFSRAALTYPTALTLHDLGTALAACDDQRGAEERWRAARRLYARLSNADGVAAIDALLPRLLRGPACARVADDRPERDARRSG